MQTITFCDLSLPEAEDLILQVWLRIEKRQISTPKLISRWQTNRLQISLTFSSEAECATVARGLWNALSTRRHLEGLDNDPIKLVVG
jgi:hypothetical protein